MKKYSSLEVDCIFDEIWEGWINKNKEAAARKALQVTLDSGNNHKDIIKACKIYSLESEGDEFTCQLNNFLLQNLWLDVQGDINKLEEKRNLAKKVLDKWNELCKSHWCQVIDTESRVPLVAKALENKFFRENWNEALDKASRIFKYKFREGDTREKIILSIRWFTNVSVDKHTVIRIMEGEYGEAKFERIASHNRVKTKEVDWEKRKEALEYFRKIRDGEEVDSGDDEHSPPEDNNQDGFRLH